MKLALIILLFLGSGFVYGKQSKKTVKKTNRCIKALKGQVDFRNFNAGDGQRIKEVKATRSNAEYKSALANAKVVRDLFSEENWHQLLKDSIPRNEFKSYFEKYKDLNLLIEYWAFIDAHNGQVYDQHNLDDGISTIIWADIDDIARNFPSLLDFANYMWISNKAHPEMKMSDMLEAYVKGLTGVVAELPPTAAATLPKSAEEYLAKHNEFIAGQTEPKRSDLGVVNIIDGPVSSATPPHRLAEGYSITDIDKQIKKKKDKIKDLKDDLKDLEKKTQTRKVKEDILEKEVKLSDARMLRDSYIHTKNVYEMDGDKVVSSLRSMGYVRIHDIRFATKTRGGSRGGIRMEYLVEDEKGRLEQWELKELLGTAAVTYREDQPRHSEFITPFLNMMYGDGVRPRDQYLFHLQSGVEFHFRPVQHYGIEVPNAVFGDETAEGAQLTSEMTLYNLTNFVGALHRQNPAYAPMIEALQDPVISHIILNLLKDYVDLYEEVIEDKIEGLDEGKS